MHVKFANAFDRVDQRLLWKTYNLYQLPNAVTFWLHADISNYIEKQIYKNQIFLNKLLS